MQRFCFFLLLPLWLFTNTAQAQPDQLKLNRLFTDLQQKGNFNGTVLVARDGQVVYRAQFGYADHERKISITENTVFELASVSKQFTAMGVMILQEKDLLDYDDSVDKYLPGFPYRNITIRHLLNMMSGLPDYLKFTDQLPQQTIVTNQLIFDLYKLKKPALQFEPGDRFAYANINYLLLAGIIERVSGVSFSDFLSANIFGPVGMTNTRSYTTRFTEGEILKDYAIPYVLADGRPVPAGETPETQYIIALNVLEGDGSIVSTAPDLLNWANGLRDNTFVSAATMAEAHTAPVFNDGTKGEYGFGVYLGKDKVWHWGGWRGVQTSLTRYLDDDTVAIYLKNVEKNNWAWLEQFEKLIGR